MVKEDCKYWDKCYQKNEEHLQKYNHPKKESKEKVDTKEANTQKVQAVKRKSSDNRGEDEEQAAGCSAIAKKREEIDTADIREEVFKHAASKNYVKYYQEIIIQSVQQEYDDLLRTNEFIRHKFLVEMPPDFYKFWKFVSELKKDVSGEEVLQYFEKQFQLQLVGPFEFLGGRFHNAKIREPGDYLRHWRFYYDPPEFQTLFVRRGTGIHYGYWRDTPQEKEGLLIARNDVTKGCEFEFIAGNIFDAFRYFLDKDFVGTPFTAAMVSNTKKALLKFLETNETNLGTLEILRKTRNLKVVTKTFHRAGIVVPYDEKTQIGYRPLIVTEAELKKIIKLFETAGADIGKDDNVKTAVIEKLQPVATAASIALDECDFGTSLELGTNLFCSGRMELHMLVQSLLVPAYTLLNRPHFIAVSKAHLEKRSKGFKLSIFDLDKE